jgi:excisionase family DNA binding protein
VPASDRPATLTVAQTAQLLNISLRAAYRAIEAGHIQVIRLGRRILVPTAPLEQLLGLRPDPETAVEREAS